MYCRIKSDIKDPWNQNKAKKGGKYYVPIKYQIEEVKSLPCTTNSASSATTGMLGCLNKHYEVGHAERKSEKT